MNRVITRERVLELLELGNPIMYSITHDKYLIRDPKMSSVRTIRRVTAIKLIKYLHEIQGNKFIKRSSLKC